CIHALFRDICLDKAHPLINPKQPLAKAAFFGFFVGNAFRCRLAPRRGRYASVVPDGGFWSLAGTLPDASTPPVRALAFTGHADGARSAADGHVSAVAAGYRPGSWRAGRTHAADDFELSDRIRGGPDDLRSAFRSLRTPPGAAGGGGSLSRKHARLCGGAIGRYPDRCAPPSRHLRLIV